MITELGYKPWSGTLTDESGDVTTLVKADGWLTDIWVTNGITAPGLNDADGKVITRHDEFEISINGGRFANARKHVDSTYSGLRAKLSSAGYQIADHEPPHCDARSSP